MRQTDQKQETGIPPLAGRVLYSVIRYVPSVLREEFVNVGVVVVSPGQNWHGLKVVSSFGDESRVKLLPSADGMFVRHALSVLTATLKGMHEWSEQSFDDLRVAYSANNIQLTAPRPAVAADSKALLESLFVQLVEGVRTEKAVARTGRGIVREQVRTVFTQRGLFKLGLKEDYTLPLRSAPVVDLAYQNGVWHCYQALGLDVEKRRASQEVNAYRQAVTDARNSDTAELAEGRFAVFTNGRGDTVLRDHLLGLLTDQRVEVFSVDDAPTVAMQIQDDLRAHDLMPLAQA